MLTAALTDAAQRGLMPATDIGWVVDLRARRAARQYAAQYGGPGAAQAMRDYQQAAVELGFLHNRLLRGTAPKDWQARGQEFVARINAVRPHIAFPGQVVPVAMSTDARDDETTKMLTALVQLRGALQAAELPLDLRRRRRAARRPAGDGRPARGLRHPAADDARGAAAHRGRRLHRRRQVDAGQLPRRPAGSPRPACSGRPPGRRCSCTTPTTPAGSARTGCCPTSSASHHSTDDPDALQLVPSECAAAGLAILDAPDVDSVEERNRQLAAQLLAAADLWLFVTSAARYADQVPWDFLKQAAERSTSVAIVLDRTPDEATADRLDPPGPDAGQPGPQGLAAVHRRRGQGRRRRPAARRPRGRDPGLARSRWPPTPRPAARSSSRRSRARSAPQPAVVRRRGRRRPSRSRPPTQLRADADAAYDDAIAAVAEASADGTLLRGEVLARWQEFVGTGELLRSLETRVGWIRDRVVNAVKGKPQQAERVTVAVESGLETLILEHAEAAAERAEAAWRQSDAGRALLASAGRGPRPGLARPAPPRRARGPRVAAATCSRWCAARAPTSATPRGSWRSASTGCRSR